MGSQVLIAVQQQQRQHRLSTQVLLLVLFALEHLMYDGNYCLRAQHPPIDPLQNQRQMLVRALVE